MATPSKVTIEKKNATKIIGIQFSILSPNEIRNGSVAEITSKNTFDNQQNPEANGLFDPRMGVLEPTLVCPTDGLNYINTPGYFGHIELARPLFYIQYLQTVIKLLRCVCIKCSKILIDKQQNHHYLQLTPEQRWALVFSMCSKVKRCGEQTDDGCGTRQPTKIKKIGFAKIVAEWDRMASEDASGASASSNMSMTLTPEIIIKCFRRISDDDVVFLGFSPIWSRPDWMLCQVLAVPPPAVRPSVKTDQQRSDDDITHALIYIIKTNTTLKEKMDPKNNTPANIIDDCTNVLQYYVATLIDNKIPGMAAVAQRSGRPLKSIKERLNGKHGRVRGNLMGKRVDYSARSVITPDPNLSIEELGIPLKIAMNLTKPVLVNERNQRFLQSLVQNGPEIHPGAKMYVKKNGLCVYIRKAKENQYELQVGDTVHRHIMDGDAVLFNRQPTLHRMSMMCHIAKIMYVGDTFRMNVGDTKPYNADFDGDEMNMHMPQDVESEAELLNLAAVTYQIISPANNKSIIGIFQDSLVGAYQFTRANITFSPREAMNLLMAYDRVDVQKLQPDAATGRISSLQILSQILPPLSLKYKTKLFKDSENTKTSLNVLEINNGEYMNGQMEKGVLGDGTKGLIHRICNDFGSKQAVHFIDDLQNIITEYMKVSAFSVGVSDLLTSAETKTLIAQKINDKKQEVQDLIDQVRLGVFDNKTGKSNDEEFEFQINNILTRAMSEAGKVGRESLVSSNRFLTMVNAGSKGSDINISQMIACLGQQNVDNKRIPYGFENRTLPHFTKYDDSPAARGFVGSSFIAGLKPEELFFHAMGGRIGIIDTAVKTSQTGYIQRRLIKGLEDLSVSYDMTVRNNKGKIIQFSYGDDGFDPVKVESQILPIAKMTVEEIYVNFLERTVDLVSTFVPSLHTQIAKEAQTYETKVSDLIQNTIKVRDDIVKCVFGSRDNETVNLPVAFQYIINNVKQQFRFSDKPPLLDLTLLEALLLIEDGLQKLKNIYYVQPTPLFTMLYFYHMNPTNLLLKKRFTRAMLLVLLEKIILAYKHAIIAPGEMVGMIAAQSIGEPTTQMTLNTFHFAGVASKSNVTRGIPRIEEILSLSANPKAPSCTVFLLPKDEQEQLNAVRIMPLLEHTPLRVIVNSVQVCFDPKNDLIAEDKDMLQAYAEFMRLTQGTEEQQAAQSKWIIRMVMNPEEMLDRNVTMDDVHFAISAAYGNQVSCVYSDYNSDNLVFRIRFQEMFGSRSKPVALEQEPLDQSDEIYKLKALQDAMLDNIVLRGIKKIRKVTPRKITDGMIKVDTSYEKREIWVLDTQGTNLMDLLSLNYIDTTRTYTNDIQEIYDVLGIEAARQAIFNEITDVIVFDGTYINFHHLSLLCDRMTCNDASGMVSIFRHGINNDDIGPIAKASFEETPEQFLKAARHAELDIMRGVSANVMCGQEGYFGTNAFQVILDLSKFTSEYIAPVETSIFAQIPANPFKSTQKQEQPLANCSPENLEIRNNVQNLLQSSESPVIDNTEIDTYTLEGL